MIRPRLHHAPASLIGSIVGLAVLAGITGLCLAQVELPGPSDAKEGFSDSPDGPVEADTLRVYRLGEILVTAPAPRIIAEPGRTEVA